MNLGKRPPNELSKRPPIRARERGSLSKEKDYGLKSGKVVVRQTLRMIPMSGTHKRASPRSVWWGRWQNF